MMDHNRRSISLSLALALTLGLGAHALAAEVPSFPDVPDGHWAARSISAMAEGGIMVGTGKGLFEPDKTLTMAEFSTMLARQFFPERVAGTGKPWYVPYVAAAREAGVLEGVSAQAGEVLTRCDMALMIYGTAQEEGFSLTAADSKDIPDWSSVPQSCREAVAACYGSEVLIGVDTTGTFSGSASMTRAQAAVVMDRLIQVSQAPAPTSRPSGSGGYSGNLLDGQPPASDSPVGTISDSPVTLSLDTHRPVTDHWSSAPAKVRELVDQDMYNAAVQTIRDAAMLRQAGQAAAYVDNQISSTYHYACFSYSAATRHSRQVLGSALRMMRLDGCAFELIDASGSAEGSGVGVVRASTGPTKYDDVFAPILAQLTAGMSDTDKVRIMAQAVCDRFHFDENARFDWFTESLGGGSVDYTNAFTILCRYGGVPCVSCAGSDRSWALVYADRAWSVVDAAGADAGTCPLLQTEAELEAQGYSQDREDLKAVVEALWSDVFDT